MESEVQDMLRLGVWEGSVCWYRDHEPLEAFPLTEFARVEQLGILCSSSNSLDVGIALLFSITKALSRLGRDVYLNLNSACMVLIYSYHPTPTSSHTVPLHIHKSTKVNDNSHECIESARDLKEMP